MEQNQNTKQNNIISKFSTEASIPDQAFRENLKRKVLSRYEENNLFFNLFTMSNSLKVAGGIFATFFVALLAGAGFLGYNYYLKPTPNVDTPKLDKETILAKILENNSPDVLNNSNASSFNTKLTQQQQKNDSLSAESTMMKMPYFDQYSYTFDSYTTEYGNAKSKCETDSFDYSIYYKSESYSYNDPNDYTKYRSKYISYDKDGNIMNIFLSNNDESITYNGGKYALKYIYDNTSFDFDGEPMPLETEDPLTEEYNENIENQPISEGDNLDINDYQVEDIYEETEIINYDDPAPMTFSDFFGEDVELEEIEDEGKTVYLVTSKYVDDCSMYYPYSSTTRTTEIKTEGDFDTIITQHYVKQDTYEIYKTISYLNEIDPKNLMSKSTTYSERKDFDFSEVADIFEFGVNVPFKEFKSSDTNSEYNEKYNKAVKDAINKMDGTLLVPDSKDLVFSSFYDSKIFVETEESLVYKDRDFYPEGPTGDELHEQANMDYSELYPTALYTLSYNTQDMMQVHQNYDPSEENPNAEYGYLNIDVYSNKVALKDIIWSETYREEKSNIIIDGKPVSVARYFMTYPEVIGYDSNTNAYQKDTSYEDPIPLYIFEYNGLQYRISASKSTPTGEYINAQEYLSFKSLNLSEKTNREEFIKLVENTLILY